MLERETHTERDEKLEVGKLVGKYIQDACR